MEPWTTLPGAPRRRARLIYAAVAGLALLAAAAGTTGCVRRSGARGDAREERITHDGAVKHMLRFSPDGRTIAYAQRQADGKALFGVMVRPVSGGEPRWISPDTIGLLPLRWSADGSAIYCMDTEGRRLYRLGLDRSLESLGGAGPLARFADVSPDGQTRLVLLFRKDNRDVDVLGPDGPAGKLAATPEWEQGAVLGPGPGQVTVASQSSFESPLAAISIRTLGEPGSKELPLPEGRKYQPAWSPDGRQLAYVVSTNGQLDLWLYDSGTAAAVPTVQDPQDASFPQWSPDGEWLAFCRSVKTSRLFAGERGAPDRRQLTQGPANDFDPKGSPDGRWIAFMRRSAPGTEGADRVALMVMPAAGGPATELDLGGRTLPLKGSDLVWSNDSQQLAFSAREGSGGLDIYRIRRDGTGLLRVTVDPGDELDPRWSPDGRQISYTRVGGGRTLVAVLPANGGVARVISGENALSEGNAWAPDGSELVYMTYRPDGGFELWRTPAAAPEHRRLVLSSRELTWPMRWTPDGTHVLLVRGSGQTWYFTALELATGKEQRIAIETLHPAGSTMTVKILPEGERYRELLFPAGMLSAEGEESADFYMIRARDLGAARQVSAGTPGFSWIARASWGGFY